MRAERLCKALSVCVSSLGVRISSSCWRCRAASCRASGDATSLLLLLSNPQISSGGLCARCSGGFSGGPRTNCSGGSCEAAMMVVLTTLTIM